MIVRQIASTFLFIFFWVSLHLLCNFPITSAQQNSTFPSFRCINTSDTTQPSTRFRSHLINMIAVLQLRSNSELFNYNYSGSYELLKNEYGGSEPTHFVYASYLCRGDINLSRCHDCVSGATETALQNCYNSSKEAVVWNDVCTFRYSDQPFYGQMHESPHNVVAPSDTLNATSFNVTEFQKALKNATDAVVAKLESGSPFGKKFATAAANVSESESVYALGECTWELLMQDCGSCLHDCIKLLPPMKTGGRVLFPSCNVRFETYQFYRVGANAGMDDRPVYVPIRGNPRDSPPPSSDVHPKRNPENRPIGRKIDPPKPKRPSYAPEIASVGATLAAMILVISCALFYAHKRKTSQAFGDMEEITSVDSLQLDFHKIRVATRNFAVDKKLGQGGFGEVYKGRLDDGQVVAVKRLSRDSGQGIAEFKTEILLVANLQHRNLVKLLGFCLSGKEKILVYEFLANSSLDRILFDPMKRETLSWETRFKIISGIAKGLLYLHEDSRLKIIHRDLKTSNILLDDFMNPKISDFGMAKLFGVDQTQDATKTIVGTYGYMAPEYMLTGQYSVKSDVYSFGIIVLEMVTGLRNSYMNRPLLGEALLHRAWRLWNEGSAFNLVDYVLGDSYSREEVIKCIHIGLLCIQEDASRRPKMTWVVAAIRDEMNHFPAPTPPNFFNSIRSCSDTGTSTDPGASSSTGREPSTELHGR